MSKDFSPASRRYLTAFTEKQFKTHSQNIAYTLGSFCLLGYRVTDKRIDLRGIVWQRPKKVIAMEAHFSHGEVFPHDQEDFVPDAACEHLAFSATDMENKQLSSGNDWPTFDFATTFKQRMSPLDKDATSGEREKGRRYGTDLAGVRQVADYLMQAEGHTIHHPALRQTIGLPPLK
jgi:hypothetical protein